MNIFSKIKQFVVGVYRPKLTPTQVTVQIDRLAAAIKRRDNLPTEVLEDARYLADAAKICLISGRLESARDLIRDAWELLIDASIEAGV